MDYIDRILRHGQAYNSGFVYAANLALTATIASSILGVPLPALQAVFIVAVVSVFAYIVKKRRMGFAFDERIVFTCINMLLTGLLVFG